MAYSATKDRIKIGKLNRIVYEDESGRKYYRNAGSYIRMPSKIGRVFVYGRGDKLPEGVACFNVTSKSKDDFKKLSPFNIGPLEVEPFSDGRKFACERFENAWQFLKLYRQHEKDTDKYLDWAKQGWGNPEAVRFPMGRGAKPECSLWKGQRLGYIEARFKIYAPLYAACVEKYASGALDELRSLLESGKDVALFDFDGYNYLYNSQTLEDVIYNSKRKMGHAFVIAMILTGKRVWEKPFDSEKIRAASMKRSVY